MMLFSIILGPSLQLHAAHSNSPFGEKKTKQNSLQTKPDQAEVQSMLNEEKMSRTQSNCLYRSLPSHRRLNLSFVLVVLVSFISLEMGLFFLVCKEHWLWVSFIHLSLIAFTRFFVLTFKLNNQPTMESNGHGQEKK